MTEEEVWQCLKDAKADAAFPEEPAVIVRDLVETKFKENGASVTQEEVLVLILNEEGATRYPSIKYDYNPRTANIEILDVKVYRDDGKTIETVPAEAIQTVPAPVEGMYWNFVQVSSPTPRLFENDALYYRIKRQGLNLAYLGSDNAEEYLPPQRDHFFDSVYFEDELPIIRKVYTLIAPRTKPVQYKLVNGAVSPSVLFEPEAFRYVWERENVPAFVKEPYAAEFSEAACELVMATLEDWEAKSRWAYEVNEPQFVISDAMRAKVSELTAGAKTDYEKQARLLHWVADHVRYLGLDMGEGEGYTVHKTDEIFAERAGVCKDKAAVLVSMLRAAGFETYFILTLAMEQAVDVPADQFNHGVVGVKNQDGTWTFLDPTWAPTDRPLFNNLEQEQPILIATPEGEDLRSIPYSPPEDNPWIMRATTTLALDKPTVSSIQIEGDGFPDGIMRSRIAYRAEPLKPAIFSTLAAVVSPFARITAFSYGDCFDYEHRMKLAFTVELENYTLAVKDRLYFVPPLSKHLFQGRWDADFLYAAEPETRTHEFTLACTRLLQFEETINLPKGYRLVEQPKKVELDNPAISLNYEVKDNKKSLVVTNRIVIKKRWIAAKEYKEFKEVVTKINELREQNLILAKGGAK